MIVLFIIWHTRNRAQGTPWRKPISGYSDQTQPILHRKSNRDSGSSVERMADGDQKHQVVHPARRMEGHVPRSPSGRTLRRDQSWHRWNRSQGNHLVSRAFAGSMWYTRSSSGSSWRTPSPCMLLAVDPEARTCRSPGWEPPKRDLGTMTSNSFQVKENDRKTIRMKSELKLSHFTEVPKATQEEMKGTYNFFLRQEGTVDENRRLPSTLAGLTTKTPMS